MLVARVAVITVITTAMLCWFLSVTDADDYACCDIVFSCVRWK